jgi:hypothetical protein
MYLEKCEELFEKTAPELQQLVGDDADPVRLKLTNTDLLELYEMAQRWNVTLDRKSDQDKLELLMRQLNDPAIVPDECTTEELIEQEGGEAYRAPLVEKMMTSNAYRFMFVDMLASACLSKCEKTLPELYEMAQRWNVTLDIPREQFFLDRLMQDANNPICVGPDMTAEELIEQEGGEAYRAQLIQKLAYHDDSHEEDQESVQGEGANSSSADGEETSELNTSAAISVVEEPTSPQMFLYLMMHDDGFAPCFDGDLCTLATCKKDIRLHANPGDVIVGLMSQTLGKLCDRAAKSMIWCGTVDYKVTLQEYYLQNHGRRDCIYDNNLNYIDNPYHLADDEDNIRKDKEGRYVLVFKDVHRFGDRKVDGSVLLGEKQGLTQGYVKHPVMPELQEILKQSGGFKDNFLLDLVGTSDKDREERTRWTRIMKLVAQDNPGIGDDKLQEIQNDIQTIVTEEAERRLKEAESEMMHLQIETDAEPEASSRESEEESQTS